MRSPDGDPGGVFVEALSKELPGMVTGFVVIAAYLDTDGDTRLFCDTMENQKSHQTLGLLSFGMAVENRRVADAWAEDDE